MSVGRKLSLITFKLIIVRDPQHLLVSSRSELFDCVEMSVIRSRWTHYQEIFTPQWDLPVNLIVISSDVILCDVLWNLEEMVTAQFLPLKASQILGSRNHPRHHLTSISLHARHNVLQIIKVICWQRWLTWNFYLNFSVTLDPLNAKWPLRAIISEFADLKDKVTVMSTHHRVKWV